MKQSKVVECILYGVAVAVFVIGALYVLQRLVKGDPSREPYILGLDIQSSKSVSDIVNESIASTMINNQADCSQQSSSQQVITVGNIHLGKHCGLTISDISQQTMSMPNMECLQNSANKADMISKMKQNVSQALENEKKGVDWGDAAVQNNEEYNYQKNQMIDSINFSDVMNCVQSQINQQMIDIGKNGIWVDDCGGQTVTVTNLTQTIVQKGVANCTQINKNTASIAQKLDNLLSQKASNKSSGLDLTLVLIILGCILLLPLIVFGISRLRGSSSSQGQNAPGAEIEMQPMSSP